MRIVGTSIHDAPKSSSCRVRAGAWAWVRVTAMRRPKSGFVSNHCMDGLRDTTSPTTKMAGALKPCSAAFWAISPTVATNVSWMGLVPQRTRAAGVSALLPWAINSFVIKGRLWTPMRKTKVSTAVASLSQRMDDSFFVGSSWPVTTAKDEAAVRSVTGMPA